MKTTEKIRSTGFYRQDVLVLWAMIMFDFKIKNIAKEIGIPITRCWKIIARGQLMNMRDLSKFESLIEAWT